jgi:hypothetical protein
MNTYYEGTVTRVTPTIIQGQDGLTIGVLSSRAGSNHSVNEAEFGIPVRSDSVRPGATISYTVEDTGQVSQVEIGDFVYAAPVARAKTANRRKPREHSRR